MGNISYFLGCSSPEGFHSFFGELCPTHSGGYTYIIKGGPGTGKSSLMKRINSALTDAGIETELIYCSSDPASLDGVYAPALNCWIADGTSPHTLEPKYPGAALRRHMSRLNFTKKAYGEFIGEAIASLESAKSIHDDLESIYISAMDFSHMDELAKSIAEDMLKRKI